MIRLELQLSLQQRDRLVGKTRSDEAGAVQVVKSGELVLDLGDRIRAALGGFE